MTKHEQKKRIYAAIKRFEQCALLGALPGDPHPSTHADQGKTYAVIVLSLDAQQMLFGKHGFATEFTGERTSQVVDLIPDNTDRYSGEKIRAQQLKYFTRFGDRTKKGKK